MLYMGMSVCVCVCVCVCVKDEQEMNTLNSASKDITKTVVIKMCLIFSVPFILALVQFLSYFPTLSPKKSRDKWG